MNEFKVNEYLTLRLEEKKSNIYVMDNLIDVCKFVLLNFPTMVLEGSKKMDSLDEVAEYLGWREEGQEDHEGHHYNVLLNTQVSPEDKFWVLCSNLQVWAENNYDTIIMMSIGITEWTFTP